MGPIAAIVAALGARPELPVALEVVCGRNTRLKAEVEALARGLKVPVRAHGFVNTVPQLMAAADLVVTKPGGLTTTEALATGRPMLLFEAMPGQEAGIAEYFGRAGAALEIAAENAADTLGRLLGDPALMQGLVTRARELARPQAARAIAEDALTLRRTPGRGGQRATITN
jgi:processive 1,2-diacylglycerol beta-glucosyltransferase